MGIHIVGCRSRLRLPIDMGEVQYETLAVSITQHGLLPEDDRRSSGTIVRIEGRCELSVTVITAVNTR